MPLSGRPRQALIATGVAFTVLLVFSGGGDAVLGLFWVSLVDIRIGGGLVLLILGMQTVLQKAFTDPREPERPSPGVLIGSPVLAGPGAILHTLMLREAHGALFPMTAMSGVLAICCLGMVAASWIAEHADAHWVELLSRILGLLLVAYAAEVVLTTVFEQWSSMQ